MSGLGHPHVEFGMYPFTSVAWAWDELWTAVHRHVPWLPADLTRSGDVHARWYDTDCLLTQVCGAPYALLHQGDMHLVGAFDLDIDDADGVGHYRSVLLSPHEVDLAELISPDHHVVANSADSLSGWLSLIAGTVGVGNEWPGPVTFTSAHVDSVRRLAKGEADLASLDAWSLTFIAEEEPELVDGLRRVGVGPRIPTPPITARKSLSLDQVDEIRAAVIAALDDDTTASARRALHIRGFASNTQSDYDAVIGLAPRP
jgi:ABC-type phosphate/phosphonate transport system substrate-binding protein